MVTTFEVAGVPVAHRAFDVKTQDINAPFNGAYWYMAFVAPVIFVPFSFH